MELPEGSALTANQISDEPTLNQAEAVQQQPAASCDEENANTSATEPELTKTAVLERLEHLSTLDPSEVTSDDISRCKQQFYGLHNEAVRRLRAEYAEAGNDPETFTAPADPDEERMKELLNVIKERKARLREEQEARRITNYERKLAIIKEFETLSADTDNINRHHQRAKELQAEFKAVGEVPPQHETSVWKDYQEAVERFYDQSKINKELYDYDLKKNLGEKQLLLDEARRLVDEPDVITAFRRLQELHNKWRETGPVPKEQRESIWTDFKDASAQINKRYQAYFEERKANEQANGDAKALLIDRIAAIDFSGFGSYQQWDEATKTIIATQEEWKTLGYASRKTNNALFARFRELCDKFFNAKAEYYRATREGQTANYAAKVALCEEAEALKDSTDWKATTEKMVTLQQRWREVGPVARRQSEAIWRRFQTAVDYFYDQKKKNAGGVRRAEQANLHAKKEIIERLKALDTDDAGADRAQVLDTVRKAQAEWKEVGHVPYRDKEKVYEAFRAAVDALYARYDLSGQRGRMASFESNVDQLSGDQQKLFRERERLMRTFEARKNELNTYENNLGFLSSRSKTGNSMVREIERTIERLKADLAELADKIKLLDAKL